MEFTVEFYETDAGRCPVREFLDGLKASDPVILRRCWPVWRNCETGNIIVNRFPSRSETDLLNSATWAS